MGMGGINGEQTVLGSGEITMYRNAPGESLGGLFVDSTTTVAGVLTPPLLET
jgi:hypothetical protein